jgi:hypothetical protein
MLGIGIKKERAYVGVTSRWNFFHATVWNNVFNDVAEGKFIQLGTTTTTRLLFPPFWNPQHPL